MATTIKEAVEKIRKVGLENVRKVPDTNGTVQLQIKINQQWCTIMENVIASSADDIIRQASNRVILG